MRSRVLLVGEIIFNQSFTILDFVQLHHLCLIAITFAIAFSVEQLANRIGQGRHVIGIALND